MRPEAARHQSREIRTNARLLITLR
ncbi:hypothetical protein SPHINGO8AM_80009 [Sphingomonas sp. 8AM]|nr:hypothetical protein SPHINGO8AM_80009 [Sphingomonas sp. 8AM]